MEKAIIPAEEAGEYESWLVPILDEVTKAFVSPEKAKRDKQLASGEIIEEVEIDVIEQVPLISIEELERITQEAYDEGYKKGVPDGRQAGFEEGKAKGLKIGKDEAYTATVDKIEQNLEQLQSIMQLLSQPIDEQQNQIERSLLIIITRLVKAIVGRELEMDRKHIYQLIRQSIEVLPAGAKNIVVGINPLDMEMVRANCGSGFVDSWSLVAEPSVAPGGCIVRTHASFVDSTVEQRIDRVIQQFLNRELYSDESIEEAEIKPDAAEQAEADMDLMVDDTELDNSYEAESEEESEEGSEEGSDEEGPSSEDPDEMDE